MADRGSIKRIDYITTPRGSKEKPDGVRQGGWGQGKDGDTALALFQGGPEVGVSQKFAEGGTEKSSAKRRCYWRNTRAILLSGSLVGRRSPGEAELVQLAGEPVLPPEESIFAPSKEALEWRAGRLRA